MSLGLATNVLKTLETSSSIGMFARDTGGCLVARLGLSRTKDEAKEITFAETAESAVFYFSAPALAKGTSKLFSKIYNLKNDVLSTPIKDVASNELKHVKLGKTGQILTTFGVILPFIFAIGPLKNLLTLNSSGKNKFTELVGLENKEKQKKMAEAKENSKMQAKNLLKILGAVTLGALALTAGLLLASKNKNIYKKIEPVMDKILKPLEFEKSGDLKTAHYGALIYPVSIAGYFAASRDKYETMENVRRFSVTVPLLFFGEKLIQNPIYKAADKIFKTNVFVNDKNGSNIKSYKDILKMPQNVQKQMLKSKNPAYGATFLINTMLIAAGVALLNRYETKKNYQKDNFISTEKFKNFSSNKKVNYAG